MTGRDYVDREATTWTSAEVETALSIELGPRAHSWLYDINRFEWEPDAYAAIPTIGWEQADQLFYDFTEGRGA